MFSNDVAVTTLRRDAQTFTDLETKPTGVEHGATANHLVMRQSAQLPCHVSQDVHLTDKRTAPTSVTQTQNASLRIDLDLHVIVYFY